MMKEIMLGLRTETSMHAGTGQNNGVIDLPIQREVHTDYPCIYGSSVKGAFRAHAEIRAKWGKKGKLEDVFGKEDASNAAQIAMTDARLLLLPVRSLTGHYKLVTCPAILARLQRDLSMLGKQVDFVIPKPQSRHLISNESGDIFLEEFKFNQKDTLANDLIAVLEHFGTGEIASQLVVMENNDFHWFAKNATSVTPHIAIKDKVKKVVKSGALWYEETLPPDTLLYTMLMGGDPFVDAVLNMFDEKKRPYVQIGGNETVGMGWCRVKEVQL